MEEMGLGLPCSVITSHGEPSELPTNETINKELPQTAYGIPFIGMTTSGDNTFQPSVPLAMKMDNRTSIPDVAVFELVQVWSPNTCTPQENITDKYRDETNLNQISPRKRKKTRPYSPEINASGKQNNIKRRGVKKKNKLTHAKEDVSQHTSPEGKPFECDRCKSPHIVNPLKSQLPFSKRKKHRPRKLIDPITNKMLTLCNACGLSLIKVKEVKPKKKTSVQENKAEYFKEAAAFAASLVESLQEPDAARLYCPAFKLKSCQCLQKYLVGTDQNEEDLKEKAAHLLAFIKDAKQLSKQKNNLGQDRVGSEGDKVPHGHHCQLFEDFVLTNRRYLKEELRLCERACQKILMYSNNFLHKNLKTAPNKGPRVERSVGRNALGLLKPIGDLPGEACCSNKCVTLAFTHSNLLESWRTQARLGQRSLRRVIALMLIPSGGSRANCYKFITLVTGCSNSTICQVNEHMKKTQGELEPPEHGLKKRWHAHSNSNEGDKTTEGAPCATGCLSDESEDDSTVESLASNIHIPTPEELKCLSPEEAASRLESVLQQLIQFHKLLLKSRQQLQPQEQTLSKQVSRKPNMTKYVIAANKCPRGKMQNIGKDVVAAQPIQSFQTKTSTVLEGSNPHKSAPPQHLLHILELPVSVPSVITSLANCHPSQSTIAVMTASGEFERLAVDLRNATSGTFSNVVLLPEATLEPSTIIAEGANQGATNLNYCQGAATAGYTTQQSTSDGLQQSTFTTSVSGVKANNYQLYNVNLDSATTNLLHFNY